MKTSAKQQSDVVKIMKHSKKSKCINGGSVCFVLFLHEQGTAGPDPSTVYVDMKSLRHDR